MDEATTIKVTLLAELREFKHKMDEYEKLLRDGIIEIMGDAKEVEVGNYIVTLKNVERIYFDQPHLEKYLSKDKLKECEKITEFEILTVTKKKNYKKGGNFYRGLKSKTIKK